MKVTFLGHQSWLVSNNNTHILIDPVLYDGFGSIDDNGIEIFPPRKIDIDLMPQINAIIISHEHSDHFNIPTLKKFPHAVIIVSPLFVNCIREIINDHDLVLETVDFQSSTIVGELEIILYPAGSETVFWESRVTQILIRPISEPQNSLFIAVDALVSNNFKEDIENELIALPRVIAVSNNSQLTPLGVLGSLDNYKVVNSAGNTPFVGVSLLKEILN